MWLPGGGAHRQNHGSCAQRTDRCGARKTQRARDGQMRSGSLYCEENHNGNLHHLTRRDQPTAMIGEDVIFPLTIPFRNVRSSFQLLLPTKLMRTRLGVSLDSGRLHVILIIVAFLLQQRILSPNSTLGNGGP